ncbi:MAG: NAD(P)-binding domain-containing protein [Oscillospiraceae bacterium]|nr:NAD(P)-binding domain-containing protein [Oscillospiraceae bacterium]
MRITVIGCGRWGTCIAWYLDKQGHEVTLCGRPESKRLRQLMETRRNEYIAIPESIRVSHDPSSALDADTVVISVGSQDLRGLLRGPFCYRMQGRRVILCMKGLETGTGKRLSEIAEECLDPSNRIAVWLGPGHVQDLSAGIPACMVIDSRDEALKKELAEVFSSRLIRIYTGNDLIGNEIGAAAKNVVGIAAGFLDALCWHSLKGALMARGAREISRLISAMGGNEISAYGLCHLGDYEATLFSPYSNNRRFGEAYVRGESFGKLAEGYSTALALNGLSARYGVSLPICGAVYSALYESADVKETIESLFERSLKPEFWS